MTADQITSLAASAAAIATAVVAILHSLRTARRLRQHSEASGRHIRSAYDKP